MFWFSYVLLDSARDYARLAQAIFRAVPYLQAMSTLTDINQPYGYDSGEAIVQLFSLAMLAPGAAIPRARVKAELKGMLK